MLLRELRNVRQLAALATTAELLKEIAQLHPKPRPSKRRGYMALLMVSLDLYLVLAVQKT